MLTVQLTLIRLVYIFQKKNDDIQMVLTAVDTLVIPHTNTYK